MNVRAVQQALNGMSQKPELEALDTAYEEAMTRINQQRPGYRDLAKKVLAWIVFAKRELSIEELQEAVAIEPGMDDINRDNDMVDEDELISYCAGLVTLDQESQVVRLVHYTTQEFFERKHAEWFPEGQELVAQGCINYLCMSVFDYIPETCRQSRRTLQSLHQDYIFSTYKMLDYIGSNWGYHTASLKRPEQYVDAILCNQDRILLTSQILDMKYGCGEYIEWTGLMVGAWFNDTKAAQLLLAMGANPNQTDPLERTPLSLAASQGSSEVVTMLLARSDVDINLGQPLCEAAFKGHKEIVEILLARSDVDVNRREPLSTAAFQGHKEIVEMLLARSDVDVNLGELLSNAAYNGHKEIIDIEMLLARSDIDVNRGEPLQWAAYYGHKEIVGILLARSDVDVNHGEPLRWAANHGHKEIVDMFLADPRVEKKGIEHLISGSATS